MALYENIFIVRQDVSSAQVDAISDSFEEVIRENGGSVAKREYWGLRSLAYRVKKNKKGHYVLFNIDAPAKAIQELAHQMRLHEDVLRELTIRLDSFPETPSPIMLTKSDRDRDRASRDSVRTDSDSKKTADNKEEPEQVEVTSKELKTKADGEKVKAASVATIDTEKSIISTASQGDKKDDAGSEKPKSGRATKAKSKSIDSNDTKPDKDKVDTAVKPKKTVKKKPTVAKNTEESAK